MWYAPQLLAIIRNCTHARQAEFKAGAGGGGPAAQYAAGGQQWQQLPDGFLALALADEHSALSSRPSLSEGTAHAEGLGHAASPGMTDDEGAAPELPVLHLQVHRLSMQCCHTACYSTKRDSMRRTAPSIAPPVC